MAKRMLIDATHPEETRIVVLNGNRLEEFDFETSTKKQIKGNIYLAKVTRVEPSLQAAFVEYGGNRHGFLAFSEIHPDYYRIPVSDREAIMADEQRYDRRDRYADAEPAPRGTAEEAGAQSGDDASQEAGDADPGYDESYASEPEANEPPSEAASDEPHYDEPGQISDSEDSGPDSIAASISIDIAYGSDSGESGDRDISIAAGPVTTSEADAGEATGSFDGDSEMSSETEAAAPTSENARSGDDENDFVETEQTVETLGGDEIEEDSRKATHHHYRHYKVQEVIKRRQILLIQVTKEERGNKGAALTTYLSLAGRYCVLMPNAGRGGGVSRKITSPADRRRLKELMEELQVPDGMGVIVRTAGSERSKAEIHRDYEYLVRLWDEIRELTLRSSAPAMIYEEGNLIKRAIRDLYSRDIEEVLIEGEDGYRTARSFMQMLMPSHTNRVKLYRDPTVPLFHRYQVDTQIDQIHNPVVQLRSGGYIVINPTEALVAIDVNSGRSTRERNIEETATKTNIEAAEEIARQLRLRDLAGLIVIDFIDMEEGRNQAHVERRLKEAMRNDRARIQLGRISPFGLLELSRQRLRSSLIEASTQPCPHCNGTGTIRSPESAALVILRALEEEGIRRRTAEITVAVHPQVALYILNHKRDALSGIEQRYGFHVVIDQDELLVPPAHRLDRLRPLSSEEIAALEAASYGVPAIEEEAVEELFEDDETESDDGDSPDDQEGGSDTPSAAEGSGTEGQGVDGQGRRRKRRRKRRRGGEGRTFSETGQTAEGPDGEPEQGSEDDAEQFEGAEPSGDAQPNSAEQQPPAETVATDGSDFRRRRRGRRGGRRRGADDRPEQTADFGGYPPPEDFARDGREMLFGDDADQQPMQTAEPEPSISIVAESGVIAAGEADSVGAVAEPPVAKARAPRRRKPAAAAEGETSEAAEAKPARRPRRTRNRPEGEEALQPPEAAAPSEPTPEQPVTATPDPVEQPVAAQPDERVAPAQPAPEPELEGEPQPRRSGWWSKFVR